MRRAAARGNGTRLRSTTVSHRRNAYAAASMRRISWRLINESAYDRNRHRTRQAVNAGRRRVF